MILSIKAKQAIKVSLALVTVYWIAMSAGWMTPCWAAFAVAMIALPTAGQSIYKGMLRVAGTIPGCIAALTIMALAPQSRWGLLLLACAWILFTTYMMLFYRLLGGYRGVSDAALAYARAAGAIDWKQWQEEKFS